MIDTNLELISPVSVFRNREYRAGASARSRHVLQQAYCHRIKTPGRNLIVRENGRVGDGRLGSWKRSIDELSQLSISGGAQGRSAAVLQNPCNGRVGDGARKRGPRREIAVINLRPSGHGNGL